MTYTVEVSREGGSWIADVVDLAGAHTYAGNLTALYENLYEAIGLMLDSPEGEERPSLHLVFVDDGDALIAEAARVGEERAAAEAEIARLQAVIPDVARSLADAGYSMRDIAGALHLSAGRVSQVLTGGSNVTALPAAAKRSATKAAALSSRRATSGKLAGSALSQKPSSKARGQKNAGNAVGKKNG